MDLPYNVRDGILVFFPSCFIMKEYHERWATIGIVRQIRTTHGKEVYAETQDKSFETTMKLYKNDIRLMESDQYTTGAIFFGVFRGKISEGISLKDDYCRWMVSVGILFGSLGEPRVILKKEHLNNMEKAVAGGAYRPWGQMLASDSMDSENLRISSNHS